MIQSMTGFGSAEKDGVRVNMRSLNNRHIEISVKLPQSLLEHEADVRWLIKERFGRGKFDVTVSVTENVHRKVRLDKELAREIYSAFIDLQKDFNISGTLNIDFFSGYKNILISEEPDFSPETLFDAIGEALSSVETMRKREGEALFLELSNRFNNLTRIHAEIEKLSDGRTVRCRDSLLKKIEVLVSDIAIDKSRLLQETAFLAQKCDITEELARLQSHMEQFDVILSSEGAVGRRLEFLLQEMNRETNTIASKTDDINVINLTLELKNELEKLREQAQNIQ
ncbi:MAG: YicC family protein [Nitrospirae bacterium]|nr:YicC family protein [Nitrospirota bacterium]